MDKEKDEELKFTLLEIRSIIQGMRRTTTELSFITEKLISESDEKKLNNMRGSLVMIEKQLIAMVEYFINYYLLKDGEEK